MVGLTGCSAAGGSTPPGDDDQTPMNPLAPATPGAPTSTVPTQGGGFMGAVETPVEMAPVGSDEACSAVVQRAEKRVGGNADIIIAVDNSLSMSEEAAAVRNNLNQLSGRIAASGIDVRVVLISAPPPEGGMGQCVDPTGIACLFVPGLNLDSNGICIDPPLGAPGACPAGDDSNPAAGYLHIRESVNSNDALSVMQRTFPQWQGTLRPDATKTVVVVTDDEARGAPSGDEFRAFLDSQSLFQSALWRFSGVFCSTDSQNCASIGSTYSALVQATGGISGDLALFATGQVDAQFKAVIDSLADLVVQDAIPVDCEWTIPPPPDGEQFDPDSVNVRYTNATGATQLIYSVANAGACTTDVGGWYYDNPAAPTRVIACPQSCATVQADDQAQVEVLFGCAREEPPIR